ncbi:DUF2971 domain-containing protein [Abyssibacter profundi]|uniref:DUF2971 domain-containing protein n=1 Tax=Abyssibacter profundi TaxID=2182787 RepID=A0A383XQH0_9GAMM|nr:DUF2971 domain-containing protein [Abyssibacter profundi]PWN54874.1 DUF2971 domain-containing protein [Abyssibacter profundi]
MSLRYGHNHRGLVIEVDEERITENFPDIDFRDVDYQDEAHDHILDLLYTALKTGKPRHTHFLTQAVLIAAYYTKRKCWSYEEERRLVTPPDHIEESSGLLILPLPVSCVSGIISGYQAEPETVKLAKDLSTKIGCNYYHAVIGKSTAEPYFSDAKDNIFTFNNGTLSRAKSICKKCREPVSENVSICPWCSIDESHQRYAAGHNPMRVIDNFGLLQNYLQGMREIDEGRGH